MIPAVLALSDGVFAIILTLLVLEIRVPELGSDDGLGDALREIRPSFIAFISFVVVANAWARHRDLFALIRRTDRPVIWLNILYMLPLAILPFGTELLARYNRDAVALEIYGLILVAIQLTRAPAVWGYVTGRLESALCPGPGTLALESAPPSSRSPPSPMWSRLPSPIDTQPSASPSMRSPRLSISSPSPSLEKARTQDRLSRISPEQDRSCIDEADQATPVDDSSGNRKWEIARMMIGAGTRAMRFQEQARLEARPLTRPACCG